MQNQHRHLAAILFTDIVGYTGIMQRSEQQAITTIKRHNSVMQTTVAAYDGEILNFYGDGCLSIFSSATEALNCAIDVQKQLQTDPVVPLRIGLHIGEVFFEDSKVLGDGVNVASRIQSLGQANTILFSAEIRDKIKNQPAFQSISLGSFDFKNVDEPMEVYALANEGLNVPKRTTIGGKLKDQGLRKMPSSTKRWITGIAVLLVILLGVYFVAPRFNKTADVKGKQNSLAVLYFNNMSGDSTQEYFSDGITEEIISRLSAISDLKVKSRTSVLQYKKQSKGTKQIAAELGITNILEGSVRKQGNKVQITARLINAETDEQIWSENYDRELKDIFDVHSDIAQKIARKFQINLSETAQKKLTTPPTQNMQAYDLYLKASNLTSLADGTGGNNKISIGLLKQAIHQDPSFSDAYALLSENYISIALVALDPKRWFDSATIFGHKAIALSPDREAGYMAIALTKQWQGLYDEALKWLFKAHAINPFSINQIISATYLRTNEYGKAYEWVKMAIDYDPAEPVNYSAEAEIFFKLGLLDSMKKSIDRGRRLKYQTTGMDWSARTYYLFSGHEEEHNALCKKAFALDEKALNYQLGIFYVIHRNWKRADSLYPISSRPDDMDAGLTKIHIGNKAEGHSILKRTINSRKSFLGFADEWHHFDISRCYAALQDSRYIYHFNKAVEKGWHDFTFLEHDPFFDFVRETPEFKKLWQQTFEKNERFKADLLSTIKRLNQ